MLALNNYFTGEGENSSPKKFALFMSLFETRYKQFLPVCNL